MNSSQTVSATSHTINVEYKLPKTPAAVWRALTEPDLLAKWLMPNTINAKVGSEFTFKREPMPQFDFDGVIRCKVLLVEPHKKLSYTWVAGHLNTVVTWTLKPSSTGTDLELEHSGFNLDDPQQSFAFSAMTHGWQEMTALLIEVIEGLI